MTELPTGTVTFLFTDIEGSTRLLRALGRDYDTLHAEHQRILRECFTAHRGREVDTQGDSFFVAFARADDAVTTAIEAQRALAAYPWPGGVELRVRMGLHSGEPRATGERYIGFGVHRAARIGAVGHGGQILLSNATRELVHDELPAETALRDLGEFVLKDVDRPERLYQVEAEELRRDFPPLKAPRVEEPRPWYRRKRAIAVAGLLVLAAAAGIATLVARSDAAPAVIPNSLVKIDARTNEIVDVIRVGEDPGQVEVVGDYVFVAGQANGTLSRLDRRTGEVATAGTFDATGSITGDGKTGLWAVSVTRNEVTLIDAQSLVALDRVGLSPDVNLLQAWAEVGGGSLWLAQFSPAAVSRWTLPGLELVRKYRVTDGEYPLQVTFGGGSAWVALSVTNRLLRIGARDGRTREIPVGKVPRDPVYAFGSVWVAMGQDGKIWRIDPRTGSPDDIIEVGKGPWGLGAGEDSIWVANHCDGTVSRIDPASNEVIATVRTGFFPQWLAVGGGHVWVGLAASQGAQGLFFEECL